MGIFIYEEISGSVTKEEWANVYQETLTLIKAFPLAERRSIPYAGRTLICAVPTEERNISSVRGKQKIGWKTSLDYDTLNGAEVYVLPKDLIGDNEVDPDAGDAIMGTLSTCLNYDWSDEKVSHTYSLWDAKTQGEPYHMYLLAIACLIEDRLGEKAFVYGDITLGQCRKAVKMANQYLNKPIELPARCDPERFYARVQKLPLKETEKITLFEHFYLGIQDEHFGNFERTHFSTEALLEHWKARFSGSTIGTRGFYKYIKTYLASGFGLEELCRIVCLNDKEGNPQPEQFLKAIMDSKLHLKEKNTEDCLDIAPDSEQPYSIYTLMADFVFGLAHNPKADRYIPIEELRTALRNGLGAEYDVDKYIDEYLKKEAEAPEIPIDIQDTSADKLMELADSMVRRWLENH